jgi:hypothetical protein
VGFRAGNSVRIGRSVLRHHFWLGVAEKRRVETTPPHPPAPSPSLLRRIEEDLSTKSPMSRERALELLEEHGGKP